MKKQTTSRPILSVYYKTKTAKEVLKTNCAKHANSAVLRCVDHMQLDHYRAGLVEVFDSGTGTLHAVITRQPSGMVIVYKRAVKEGM